MKVAKKKKYFCGIIVFRKTFILNSFTFFCFLLIHYSGLEFAQTALQKLFEMIAVKFLQKNLSVKRHKAKI